MEFRQLEVFAAVAEYRSFSEAAASLYLTQSTASSHIRNLEKELRTELIVRSNRYLTLTEDGKRFLPYVQRILKMRDAALAELRKPAESVLKIGASTIPSGYLLPPLITGFRKIHPDVYFSIRQGDSREILELVQDGSIDLGFVGAPSSFSGVLTVPFCEDTLVLATPATDHYLELQKKGAGLRNLLGEPLILRERRSGTQKAADQFLSSLHISRKSLNVIAEVNDLETIRHLLTGGAGVTICSRFAVEDLERSGQVVLYSLPSEVRRSFYIARQKGRTLSERQKALMRYVLKEAGKKTEREEEGVTLRETYTRE